MSWMSPSYIPVFTDLDAKQFPLVRRYSTYLYREVGWDREVHGRKGIQPVLFIPGNAGSYGQVRSIASSAARQYFSSPGIVAPEFASRDAKSLEFFAVDFNEDLSAFHGPTLESEISYTKLIIDNILALYPPGTQIIIMGHSMGGIVATALLPFPKISAVITMSTPHTLPPARFDARIDAIYARNQHALSTSVTPIVSLCGGATDAMIPSESCVLPAVSVVIGGGEDGGLPLPFRKTVFTSALEGGWTGVGHREMVWCHQVRWRIARAALELGVAMSMEARAAVLDKWLRDGHSLPPDPYPVTADAEFLLTDLKTYEMLPPDTQLVLKNPQGSRTYLLPITHSATSRLSFVLLVSQGSISPVSPQNPLPLKVIVHICARSGPVTAASICSPLKPTSLKLIPHPIPGKSFPIPGEGSDESEGVVLYETDISSVGDMHGDAWVAVRVEDADGRGWVIGSFGSAEVTSEIGTFRLLFGSTSVALPDTTALHTHISFPNILSHTFLVYLLIPRSAALEVSSASSCSAALFQPLLMHTSQPAETHYFPLIDSSARRILLHTHSSAPHIPLIHAAYPGLDLNIYSSGSTGCNSNIVTLELSIDWSATLYRLASRYPTALVSWSAGVVALVVFEVWGTNYKHGRFVLTVEQSLSRYCRKILPKLLFVTFMASFIPFPETYYLGNRGEPMFAPIAPLLLLVATGLVFISWWMLVILMWPLGMFNRFVLGRRKEDTSVRQSVVISMCFIFLVIFFFVPWQVAFLGCWMIHLHTCADSGPSKRFSGSSSPTVAAIPLLGRSEHDGGDARQDSSLNGGEGSPVSQVQILNNHNHNMHILLLMMWLLPLAAPVLAVWVRTLVTSGLTTPFDGDHFFLNVAPFLILVDFASWTTGPIFEHQRFEEHFSARWLMGLVAFLSFFIGSRKPYLVFDAANAAVGLMVVVRIGRRYWGGDSWSKTSGTTTQ